MTLDQTIPKSRRAVLVGAFGGVAALAAQALGRPLPAAADGETIKLGGEYSNARSVTLLENNSAFLVDRVLEVSNNGSSEHGWAISVPFGGIAANYVEADASTEGEGPSIFGRCTVGTGVMGETTSGGPGVLGISDQNAGVRGESLQSAGVRAVGGPNGVFATATSIAVRGVTSSGIGVSGTSGSGVGVRADSSTGIALQAIGRVRFDKSSGRATIQAGQNQVTVSPGFSLEQSRVLATLIGNPGGATTIQYVSLSSQSFTVHLTANAASRVVVSWFVITSP
jgi:hypothetical protein